MKTLTVFGLILVFATYLIYAKDQTKEECVGLNEEWKEPCGDVCPDTCKNKDDANRPCTYQCIPSCSCKKGYVRTGKPSNCTTNPLGKCIDPKDCEKHLKKN